MLFSIWPRNNLSALSYLRLFKSVIQSVCVFSRSFLWSLVLTSLCTLPTQPQRSMKGFKHHRIQKVRSSFFWRWRDVMADGVGGGVGGIHSYSQSPTVQLQSHLLSWTLVDHSQGASQPSDTVFLWQDRACYLTPPGAPSSGGPWHTHINKQTDREDTNCQCDLNRCVLHCSDCTPDSTG